MIEFDHSIKVQSPLRRARRLVFVLGDQLDLRAETLRELDPERDAVLMVEAAREAEHVASHRQRTVLFLSAMRHFALASIERGLRVRYVRLDDPHNTHELGTELTRALERLSPERVLLTRPGEHRVESDLRAACEASGTALEIRPDGSFTCSVDEFDAWAEGRKSLVMEHFYRERRRALDLLMEGDQPTGGRWNFDADNRQTFDREPELRRPYHARPDPITREVMRMVDRRFPRAPGRMEHFRWAVTATEARRALDDFIEHRLRGFGTYEDAMWSGQAVLHHSRLAALLNLKLLDPRRCVDAAVEAYENGRAPLNDVEGFVRQIVGWREFIRGIYYREGAGYVERNELGHRGRLPQFFWTGETEMACLEHCIGEVLENAWGHHIPRLMVIGNFALLAGVHPRSVHEWFLGMYVDAVEWVTAPNVIGMSQHADGGVVGTKPYVSGGRYIQRMSNYCQQCRFDPTRRSGDGACPFTVLYWDFLLRHQRRFAKNHRMGMMLENVKRIDTAERRAIRKQAASIRRDLDVV